MVITVSRFHVAVIYSFFIILSSNSLQAGEKSLFISWNKIGCQSDNSSIFNFTTYENALKRFEVCKLSEVTYWITGDDSSAIDTIDWTIVGGTTGISNELSCKIKWGDILTGDVSLHIVFKDDTILDKRIYVNAYTPTLLFGWEVIGCDLNGVEEVKFSDLDITDEGKVCEGRTFTYKISGSETPNIETINWSVSGGTLAINNELTAPIVWDKDEGDGSVTIDIGLRDETTMSRTFQVTRLKQVGGGQILAPNSIKFNYDTEGNQIKRQIIYLARQATSNSNVFNENVRPSHYSDISYYPNPVNQQLFVKWINPISGNVKSMELYSLTGKLMHTYKNLQVTDNNTVDFNNYPSGMYTLTLEYSNGERRTLKIMKE